MSALRKNVASQVVTFCLVNATTGAALTGATVTTKVTLDGTQSASAGTLTELGTGQYKYVPTQGETNGASVGFCFTATNAVPVNLHCFTIGQDPTAAVFAVNATQLAGQTITAAAGVTFPTSVASPTNITAGTITTVTNLTNLPAAAALEATLTAMKGATFATGTDSLEAIRDRGDAAWATATGFSTLDAAGVRTAVGLATANLDTQLAAELAQATLARKILKNRTETDPATGVMTVYDDDGTTPLYTANIYTDVAGATAYDGTAGVNRRNALA